jgi:hypothetical protein
VIARRYDGAAHEPQAPPAELLAEDAVLLAQEVAEIPRVSRWTTFGTRQVHAG